MTETIAQRQLNRTLLARQMLLNTLEAETRDAIEAEGLRLLRFIDEDASDYGIETIR